MADSILRGYTKGQLFLPDLCLLKIAHSCCALFELGLQLRNKTSRRRVKAKLRDDRRAASTSNEIWAMDFVHDQLATGQKIRVLTVVDTFSRFSPVIDPRFSYRAEDVVATLSGSVSRPAIRRR